MRITIHRGTSQIGGCITEYEHDGWRLFIDYGEPLPGSINSKNSLQIDGLTSGDISKSALLITHYHADHIGRIYDIAPELPIYMGKVARDIYEHTVNHRLYIDELSSTMVARLQLIKTFIPGQEFSFGPFSIIPVVIDHSAFDAYAFRIEAKGVKVFHTGDFRTHGFRSSKLPKVIEKFVGRVDYMVCEATNVSRPTAPIETEHNLQKKFEEKFRENKYNIVYLSSTNVDRLFGLYHAALRAGRPFYIDRYQRHIMDIVTQRDPLWGKSRLYKYGEYEPKTLTRDGDEFQFTEKFHDFLDQQGYVLVARANTRFDNLIAKMPGEPKRRYLSMWQGYVNPNCEAYNKSLASSLQGNYEYMHTSGHCDMDSLMRLVDLLSPKGIIPIHTDSPETFAHIFCDRYPVILLKDGESIYPESWNLADTEAMILSVAVPKDEHSVLSNQGNYKWWSLSQHLLGYFKRSNDAKSILQSALYSPKLLLGYTIISEKGLSPSSVTVYDKDFKMLNHYECYGHAPGNRNYQELGWIKPGDKVLAIIRNGFDVVVPCEVVGPITEEYLKAETEADELCPFSYEERKEHMLDWDWDLVIVRPLIRLANDYNEIPELVMVQRVDIFPYQDFKS